MESRTLIGRLLSPAGFGLVLILFLTPFLTVSCDATGASTVTSTFTGIDLVIGGAPDMSGESVTPDVEQQLAEALDDQGELDLDIFALFSAIAVMAGMGCALLKDRMTRYGGAAALAAIAGILITAAVLRAPGRLATATQELFGGSDVPVTTTLGLRFGFWLTITVMALLAAGNGVALLQARRAPAPAAPAPPPSTEPEPHEEEPQRSSLDGMWEN